MTLLRSPATAQVIFKIETGCGTNQEKCSKLSVGDVYFKICEMSQQPHHGPHGAGGEANTQ